MNENILDIKGELKEKQKMKLRNLIYVTIGKLNIYLNEEFIMTINCEQYNQVIERLLCKEVLDGVVYKLDLKENAVYLKKHLTGLKVIIVIRFCTNQEEMEKMLYEFQRNHVNYHLFRNMNLDIKKNDKLVKYIFYIEPRLMKKERLRKEKLWKKRMNQYL